MKTLIAIDPGTGGGIAVLNFDGTVDATKMPDTIKDTCDVLAALCARASQEGREVKAYIEEVGGYIGGAGNTGSAMFKFGFNTGTLHGALTAMSIPFETVRPQKWQKDLSLGTVKSTGGKPEWKRKLKEHAQRLYPSLNVTLNTADALLILHYARKIEGQL